MAVQYLRLTAASHAFANTGALPVARTASRAPSRSCAQEHVAYVQVTRKIHSQCPSYDCARHPSLSLQAAAADEELHYLAAFLLELTLMDELLLKYLPSQLAAASVYLARAMLGRKPWDATLAHYSRYEEADVVPAAADLAFNHAHIQADGNFTAILEKYSSERLRQVASLPPFQALLPHSQSCKQYTQQQQAAAAANSSATDDNPIAGCFCSESSDMDLA
jgi:hypothetical protein